MGDQNQQGVFSPRAEGAQGPCWADLSSDLAHGVAVAQRGRVRAAVHGVKVDGDAEGDADLVGARVAPADGARCIIHLVGNASPGQGFGCREHSRDQQGLLHGPTEAPPEQGSAGILTQPH